ncbi:MAG: acetate--CoA ligase family protein [Thermoplasmataceae archaeon]
MGAEGSVIADVDIQKMFKPASIAVVGASSDPDKIGYQIVLNLKDGGYKGKIFPVNPKAKEILGLKVYPDVAAIGEKIDLALLSVPAAITPQVADECGKAGVGSIIVVASGFSEVGNSDLETKLLDSVKKYNMRMLGPNVVGLLSNPMRMNASFAPFLPYAGRIGMVSQSGAMIIALDAKTWVGRIGMSYLVSIGNMADLDFSDILTYLENDDDTSCITLYVEGIKNGRRFLEVGKKSTKPIVMLKAGKSKHGSVAASSHTGSLAGSDKIYDGAMKQAGILRAETIDDLFDMSLALSLQPTMKGPNLLIITNGGGIGVLATDASEIYGIPIDTPGEDLRSKLAAFMPSFASTKNPIDMSAMATGSTYQDVISNALQDPGVDGVVVLYCEVSNLDPQVAARSILKGKIESGVDKPVCVGMVGGEATERAIEWLQKNEIPSYTSPERAVMAMSTLRKHEILNENRKAEADIAGIRREEVDSILREKIGSGNRMISEIESKKIFSLYGIHVNSSELATSEQELLRISENFQFPVVLKIQSRDISHKFDVGGVMLGIKNRDDLIDSYHRMLKTVSQKAPDAKIDGVVVEEMLRPGLETIVGTAADPSFGPSVMFGMGGTNVEAIGDVTFRVAPVDSFNARQMISETLAGRLFKGTRGRKDLDMDSVIDTIQRIGLLAYNHPQIKEIDVNPLTVYDDGCVAVDARIILNE